MKPVSVAYAPHCGARTTVCGLTIALLLAVSPPLSAGKLGDTRDAARGGSSGDEDDDSEDSGRKRKSGGSGDGDGDSDWILACLIPFVLPFCLAAAAVDAKGDRGPVERALFLPYPYADGRGGRMVLERNLVTPAVYVQPEGEELRVDSESESGEVLVLTEVSDPGGEMPARAGGRFSGSYFYDLDGVHVPGIELLLDTASRMGLETEWRLFLEPLDAELDRLWMGRLDMNIRLIQSSVVEARFALGGRLMIDDGVWGGFDSGFSLLIFPVRPLNLSADIHLGNLGKAFYFEGRGTLGVSLNRAELFAGYRGALVQGNNISVAFHGPVAGLAVWF